MKRKNKVDFSKLGLVTCFVGNFSYIKYCILDKKGENSQKHAFSELSLSTQNPIFRQKPEILGFRSCGPVSISQQNW